MLHAKNEVLTLGSTQMDYISFGKGKDILIMLPGLGDGLTTVKGTAIPFAMSYKAYASKYKVYVFSRKNQLTEGYSTRDMAADQAEAMSILGISKAHVIGISQGGMIAQHLAIDHPQLVKKLVLTVTLAKQNDTIQKVVHRWIEMAERGKYKELMLDTAEKSYTENHFNRQRWLLKIMSRVGKPKDFSRFLIQASSCIHHSAYDELGGVMCPTLVVGGSDDRVVGNHSSSEIADKIRGSKLLIYQDFGHALYEEAKDYNSQIMSFLA